MSSAMSLARPMLRSSAARQIAARRLQSTSTEKASAAAKDAASKAKDQAAKAAQGLTRAAGAAAVAAKGLTSSLGKLGGRTGKVIAFIERQTPFVVYYAKVGAEVGKIVFQGQKMSPPSAATFQNFYQNLYKSIQTRGIGSPQSLVQSALRISPAQLAAGGVVAAECLGFFTVGEMIGRFKLVGYHGEVAHH
ncbi:hypothetical protein N3K66_005654 [Trichothecium roseum]|uniref:Uncharacterized protein n=1 Tax=Trichothecium roseum TaxID=47278 RepID=A0ACC0UZU2_9HYPO|nr:hypothetical protein N3K66_005654 [Trichothecium roseum]